MTKKSDKERGRTLPLEPADLAWWTESARAALRDKSQKDLARHTGMSESAISRLLKGLTPNIDLLIAVSDYLKIAPPVFVCRSQVEAAELARQRRLVVPESELRALVDEALATVRRAAKKRKAG